MALNSASVIGRVRLALSSMPFGQPLKTGGVYSLCLQATGAGHPACAVVMQWFAEQHGR